MTTDCAASESVALAEQRRLVARLCRADAFPHAVKQLSLIETHISFVILTGELAYKIKKAVDFGFLDYTSRDRRLFFCQEELRLNRRLAAPLYLDVVAIGGEADAPVVGHLADTSPALEYAVQMRQFDQDCLLDRILPRGELAPSDIDHLAMLIAEFHRQAPVAAADSGYGSRALIERAMHDNFVALRSLPALVDGDQSGALRAELERIEAWSQEGFASLCPVIDVRRRGGLVRECHGDLHLGNMVRQADGLQVFDGIEFSAELRWIDVISEVAFLAMDLSARGRVDYAYRFLNGYLESSGDYSGLKVFAFYFVYRALVRAKVSGLRAVQLAASSPDAAAGAVASCRSYLELAAQTLAPQRTGMVLTHGFSGSGKTHLAGQLLEAIPAIRIRSDVERKRLHGFLPLDTTASPTGGGIYDSAATRATYQRLRRLAETIIGAGFSVIVDAAFLRRWQRQDFQSLGAALAVPVLVVDCSAPAAVLIERLAQRQRTRSDASEAGAEVLALQMADADVLSADESLAVVPAACGDAVGIAERLRSALHG